VNETGEKLNSRQMTHPAGEFRTTGEGGGFRGIRGHLSAFQLRATQAIEKERVPLFFWGGIPRE